MMRKYIAFLFLFFLGFPGLLWNQCSCIDCPEPIIFNVTTFATLSVTGSTNNTLGTNGQQVCQVCMNFEHSAPVEFGAKIIAPNGSFVELQEAEFISAGPFIQFDVCFVACSEPAFPDPGQPAVWDSQANWTGGPYTGSYYPEVGCLETLTGTVNGIWTMELTDAVVAFDGNLFDFDISFADAAGIPCQANNGCSVVAPCMADGGLIGVQVLTACVGDPILNVDLTPSYPGGSPPPMPEYSYTHMLIQSGVIVDYLASTDFTTYPAGFYDVCGLSYLTADFGLLPPTGSLFADLVTDIANGVLCADISEDNNGLNNCFVIEIYDAPPDPIVDWPATLCANVTYEIEILNYDPAFTYQVAITQGNFNTFFTNFPFITVNMISGPLTMCVTVLGAGCNSMPECETIPITPGPPIPVITGPALNCPGVAITYTVLPPLPGGLNYIPTVTNGTLVNSTPNTFDIIWDLGALTGELCVDYDNGCGSVDTECETFMIEQEPDLTITGDLSICIGEVIVYSAVFDPTFLYQWTITGGAAIIAGANSSDVTVEGIAIGTANLCLSIDNGCGPTLPDCVTINIIPDWEPTIIAPAEVCGLTEVINVTLDDPSNTGEWTFVSGPGSVTFSNPFALNPTITVSTPGIYVIQFEETDGSCVGTDQVTITFYEEITIAALVFDCDPTGDFYTVSITITSGTNPFTVNGNAIAGSIFTSSAIPSGSMYSFLIEDGSNGICDLLVEGNHTCPCLSDAGTMNQQLQDVCIPSGSQVQGTSNMNFFLDGNDLGLYYLHTGNTNALGTVLAINNTGIFAYDPSYILDQIYYISFVAGNQMGTVIDLLDPCLDVAVGTPVVFYEEPTVSVIGNFSTCSLDFDIEAASNIPGVWSIVAQPPNSVVLINNPLALMTGVSTDTPGNYSFAFTAVNGTCIATDIILVNATGIPEANTINVSCNATNDGYTVSFVIINGTAPYTVNGNNINGTLFMSQLINSGTPYSFTIEDLNGCFSEEIQGVQNCGCPNSAGVMPQDFLEFCGAQNTLSTQVSNEVLEADDIGLFIIHTSSSNLLGTIITSNASGIFPYQSEFILDSIFYISYVVGDEINGQIDFNDPCLSVALGQPFIFYSDVVAMAGMDLSSCEDIVTLDANVPSNGDGQWSITNGTGMLSDINDPLSTFSAAAGNYNLEWEIVNGICFDQDTMMVEFFPQSTLSVTSILCDVANENYTTTIAIDGTAYPYTLNGTELITPGITEWTISTLSDDTTFIDIIDVNGCNVLMDTIVFSCSCGNSLGSWNQPEVNLCEGEELMIPAFTDFVLGPNEIIQYVLHDASGQVISNVLGVANNGVLMYDNAWLTSVTYFLSVAVGIPDANGNVDLTHPCTLVNNGFPISWEPVFEIALSGQDILCGPGQAEVVITYAGTTPVWIGLVNNGLVFDVEILMEGTQSYFIDVLEEGTFTIVDIFGMCSTISGMATVTYDQAQDITLVQDTVCNNMDFGSTLNLMNLVQAGDNSGVWTDPSGTLNITNGILDADGAIDGAYELNYEVSTLFGVCPDELLTSTVIIEDCNCPFVQIDMINSFCAKDTIIDLSLILTSPVSGSWSINEVMGLDNPVINGSDLILTGANVGTYELQFLFDVVLPGCPASEAITFSTSSPNSAGTPELIPPICPNELNTFNLFSFLLDPDQGGTWSHGYTNLTLSNSGFLTFMEVIPGTYDFTYTSEGTICPSESSMVTVVILEGNEVDYNLEGPTCTEMDNGFVEILNPNPDYTYQVFEQNGTLQDMNALGPGSFVLIVTTPDNCIEEFNFSFDFPSSQFLDLGQDFLVKSGTEITIDPVTNIEPLGLIYMWFINGELIPFDQEVLTWTIDEETLIELTITTIDGCTKSDDLLITLPPLELPAVLMPNIFNPNSPGENSTYGIYPLESVERVVELLIFDRWGNKVFAANDFAPEDARGRWDGKLQGSYVVPGVYVYKIQFVDGNFELNTEVGDLTMIR